MTTSTAFPQSQVARGVAIKTEYKNLGGAAARFRPVKIAVVGQGGASTTYTSDKRQVFSAAEVGSLYGYDSPLYQAALSLLPANGDGVGNIPVYVLPLQQPAAAGAQSAGTITPSGTVTKTQTYKILISNIECSVTFTAGDVVADMCDKIVAAINGVLGMPGAATDGATVVNFTVGWEGTSGDDVTIRSVDPDDGEVTLTIVQPTGGAGTVDVNPTAGGEGLALIGEDWVSHILNCLQYTDSTNLGKYDTWNEGRWQPEVYKPARVYTGTAEATLATVTAVTDARKTDRTNIICTNPGSYDLPLVVAADQLRRIAKLANENPPHDYGSQDCPRLTPGLDSVQWTSAQRQAAVIAGTSTIQVKDGVVNISDIVTCYHPVGEEPPAYRYDVDIEKVSTVIYNTDLIFNNTNWDGAPLVPDGQAVKNPTAKKPKMALAALAAMYDALADEAIISDPDFAKENTTAAISSTNPKRLDINMVFAISGNVNVLSIDLNFGFYFG